MSATAEYSEAAIELLGRARTKYNAVVHPARDPEVFGVFKEACRTIGFTGSVPKIFFTAAVGRIFDIGINAYTLVSRIYHDVSHGRTMTPTPERELQSLRDHFAKTVGRALTLAEEKLIVAHNALAGLFHDSAYVPVDGGFSRRIGRTVSKYLRLSPKPPFRMTIFDKDALPPIGQKICRIFGYEPGEMISDVPNKDQNLKGGMNEFSSAILMGHCAGGKNPSAEMAKHIGAVGIRIEGTIPFRPKEVFERLYDVLVTDFNHSPREAEIAVKAAVAFTNRDVEGFYGGPIDADISDEQRFMNFIIGTWQLIPENNVNLRSGRYTPADFIAALGKVHGFIINVVKPENTLHSFRGYPETEEMEIMNSRNIHNRKLFDNYMTAKIASASLVKAVAEIMDRSGAITIDQLVNKMDERLRADGSHFEGDNKIVFDVLLKRDNSPTDKHNRNPARDWDIQGSPIAAYLMSKIGMDGIGDIAAASRKFSDSRQFLQAIAEKYSGPVENVLSAMLDVADEKAAAARAAQPVSLKAYAMSLIRADRLRDLIRGLGIKMQPAKPVAGAANPAAPYSAGFSC